MLLNLKTSILIVLAFAFTNCGNSQKDKEDQKTSKEVEVNQIIKTVDLAEAQEIISDQSDITIIDLRTDEELKNGYLKNAIQINFQGEGFEDKIKALDKSKPYLIYCHGGGRSGSTRKMMEKEGFNEVYDMSPGFGGWSKEGLPLEKDEAEVEATEDEIANYESQINKEGLTLINFYATWCGVCKKNRPLLKDYGTSHENISIVEFDVDQNKGIKNHLNVKAVPTLLVYKNGELVNQKEGAITKEDIAQMTK